MGGTDRPVVVGADGVVGGILSRALEAVPVVYRPPREGEHAIADADAVLASARVVVNAQGFRPRPGLSSRELYDSHCAATERLIERMRPGQTLLHVSSAAVLGTARGGIVSGEWPPSPESFPMPFYAHAKWRAERMAIERAAERGIRALVIRPAVVFEHPADGMLASLARLARTRRLILRLLPGDARHHFCSSQLLGAIARALAAAPDTLRHGEAFTAADPFVVTNAQLRAQLCVPLAGKLALEIPVHARMAASVLARLGGLPGPDLAAQAQVFGVLGMDVSYDATSTFERLGLNPREFGPEQTWAPFVRATLASQGAP